MYILRIIHQRLYENEKNKDPTHQYNNEKRTNSRIYTKRVGAELTFCYLKMDNLARSVEIHLSKISNRPSEVFQSLHIRSWPQANFREAITFQRSAAFLCTRERNAIANARPKERKLIKVSLSIDISIEERKAV